MHAHTRTEIHMERSLRERQRREKRRKKYLNKTARRPVIIKLWTGRISFAIAQSLCFGDHSHRNKQVHLWRSGALIWRSICNLDHCGRKKKCKKTKKQQKEDLQEEKKQNPKKPHTSIVFDLHKMLNENEILVKKNHPPWRCFCVLNQGKAEERKHIPQQQTRRARFQQSFRQRKHYYVLSEPNATFRRIMFSFYGGQFAFAVVFTCTGIWKRERKERENIANKSKDQKDQKNKKATWNSNTSNPLQGFGFGTGCASPPSCGVMLTIFTIECFENKESLIAHKKRDKNKEERRRSLGKKWRVKKQEGKKKQQTNKQINKQRNSSSWSCCSPNEFKEKRDYQKQNKAPLLFLQQSWLQVRKT